MDFRDSYYSLEGRLNNIARDKTIKHIVVRKSENGKRSEMLSDRGNYIFNVLPNEYEQATELAAKINEEKDLYNDIKPSDHYDELCKPFETREKRDLKNKPNKAKNKRFSVKKVLVKIIAGALATGVAISGVHFAKLEAKEYKERVATESLETLKEALNAEEVWDKSSATSSISGYTSVKIIGKDGETYLYYAGFEDGQTKGVYDEIKNHDVVSSIITVANAQDGNIFEAMHADKLRKEIEAGEVDLTYPGNTDKTLETPTEEIEK